MKRLRNNYQEITSAGHSQGGLVILYYLKDRLDDDKSKTLSDIRQVILIDTPIFGSTSFLGLREFASRFFSNPQEQCLRAFDPDTAMVRARISEKVVNATGKTRRIKKIGDELVSLACLQSPER